MKKYLWSGPTESLVIACLAILFCSTFVPVAHAQSTQLIIHRSADFGNANILRIWVDGKEAPDVAYGNGFTAPISAGRHVIGVRDGLNFGNFPPTTTVLNVQAGGTYEFTAVWRNQRVFLQKD